MHYITNVEILFESNSSGEPFPLHELAEKQSTQLVEILEDSDVTGNLHYIITYNGGHQKKIILPKNKPSGDWGFEIEAFLYRWKLLYELHSRRYIVYDENNQPTTTSKLSESEYQNLLKDFDIYFDFDSDFRQNLLQTNTYFDPFLDEKVLVKESLTAFKKIIFELDLV